MSSVPERSESPVPMAPMALSPSKIQTLQCPHRYLQIYVKNADPVGVEAEELALGQLVHEVAAVYVNHLAANNRQTDLDALAAYADAAWAGRPFRVHDAARPSFELFIDNLGNVVFDPQAIVETELRFAFDKHWKVRTWASDEVAWGGIVDVLSIHGSGADSTASAIDWTTAAISGVFGLKKDLQLRHYGLLIYKAYGIAKVKIETISLRTGSRKVVELDENDHAETERRLNDERARLERFMALDERFPWPASPGVECGICQLACPAYDRSKLGEVPIRFQTVEEARGALAEVIAIERRVDALKDRLKAWTGFHGAVEVGGIEALMKPQEKRTYPVKEVFTQLVDADRDPWKVLSITKTTLNRELKKDPELLKAVNALATVKTGERFTIKKIGLEDGGEE